jgi:hypothetical protein
MLMLLCIQRLGEDSTAIIDSQDSGHRKGYVKRDSLEEPRSKEEDLGLCIGG